jgi:hypothetical protein
MRISLLTFLLSTFNPLRCAGNPNLKLAAAIGSIFIVFNKMTSNEDYITMIRELTELPKDHIKILTRNLTECMDYHYDNVNLNHQQLSNIFLIDQPRLFFGESRLRYEHLINIINTFANINIANIENIKDDGDGLKINFRSGGHNFQTKGNTQYILRQLFKISSQSLEVSDIKNAKSDLLTTNHFFSKWKNCLWKSIGTEKIARIAKEIARIAKEIAAVDNKKDQLYSFTINGKSIEYNKLSRENQDFLNSDKIESIKECIESINNNDQINNIAIDDHWKEFCTTIAGD